MQGNSVNQEVFFSTNSAPRNSPLGKHLNNPKTILRIKKGEIQKTEKGFCANVRRDA